ncbi:unnamed protein product [Withania somnifera]
MAAQYYQYPYYQTPPPPIPPPQAGATTLHALPPAVVQPPIPAYAPPPLYPQHSLDDVRTLFIAGLPEDVKPREIYNLFREFAGYESSHLRSQYSGNSQGMVFDFEKDSKLYIELAKSNSRSKRSRPDDGRPVSEKRIKGSTAISRDNGSGFGSIHMPGMGNSAYNTIGYPPTQSQGKFDGRVGNQAASKTIADPCPTLFVANLGQSCTEQELIQVFSRYRGFLKLKMQSTYGAPVAFVDFQDTASSTEALSNLQGTILYSSSGEGMRLEYAKSRMGLRSKKR